MDKKDLEVFTKDELIDFIINSVSSNPIFIFDPVKVLYQKRMDENLKKDRELGMETKKLLHKMDGKDFNDVYEISLEIKKVNKIRDKLRKENGKIEKILYEEG